MMNIILLLGALLVFSGAIVSALTGAISAAAIILYSLGAAAVGFYCFAERKKIASMLRDPHARQGANAIVYSTLVAAIAFVAGAIALANSAQFDLTKNKKNSLSPQTITALKAMKKDIEAYYFYSATARNMKAEDTLKQYEKINAKFRFFAVDADKNPASAKKFGVDRYGIVIMVRPDANLNDRVENLTEEGFTNSLLRLGSDSKRKAYFLSGHGEARIDTPANEKTGYSVITAEMQKEGYDTLSLELFKQSAVPSDCSLLVIAGPASDIFPAEADMIKAYLRRGGNMMVLLPAFTNAPVLSSLIARYGVTVENDVVVDKLSRMLGGDILMPVISQYEAHDITKNFRVASFMPICRTFTVNKSPEGVTVSVLAKTNPGSWGETDLSGVKSGKAVKDKNDISDLQPVALVIDTDNNVFTDGKDSEINQSRSKIIVFGSSQFCDNTYVATAGNKDLFLNAAGFASQGKEAVTIRAKDNSFEPVFLSRVTGVLLFLIPTVLIPLLVAAAGIMIAIRRSRQ